MMFKTKHRLLEAEQFFRDQPLPFHAKGPYVCFGCSCDANSRCALCGEFWVVTAHGQKAILADGDWVTPEPSGPHTIAYAAYPIKPDIFADRYELAESVDAVRLSPDQPGVSTRATSSLSSKD
jgi:hypothetical protein